jgi:hypothetical protein
MARRKPRKQAAPAQEDECIEFSNGPSLHVTEKGIGATFVNRRRKELRKIQYDGCYCRTSREGRADFIIGFDRRIDVILELKGSDLKHALVQVADTLGRWREDAIRYPQIVCLVVFGHTFPRMSSRLGVLEREFLDDRNTLLWIRESAEEKFSFRKLSGRS